MSGKDGRKVRAPAGGTNRDGNGNGNSEVGEGAHNISGTGALPLSGTLAGLATLVQQQQQQQQLQALMEVARNMQQGNMILQLNAQRQLQQQQQQAQREATREASAQPSLHAPSASNFNIFPPYNVAMTPYAIAMSHVANPIPNNTVSLQSAVAMLASAANLQQALAELQRQHMMEQNQQANADAGRGAAAPLQIQPPHLQTALSHSSSYQPAAGGSAQATASLSSGNSILPNQLPTILRMLEQQQQHPAPQPPPSWTSVMEALNLPASINAASMAGDSWTLQQVPQQAVASAAQPAERVHSVSTSSDADAMAPTPALTNRPPIPLYLEEDSRSLNPYQCLLRKQIELFETAPSSGVEGRSQGRNTPIRIGQVGIRCRHCASLPNKARPKGAVYYSKALDGVYQVSQNMSKVHLTERCRRIPNDIKQRLIDLHNINRRASGGKPYWVDGLKQLGVYEEGPILRFLPAPPPRNDTTRSDGRDQKKKSR